MKSFDRNKLLEKWKKEEEQKGSGKGDSRYLNYYSLGFDQQMTIRFLPDDNDEGIELWQEYGLHGPNLKNKAIKAINCCYMSSGETCPVCSHSYDSNQEGNKTEGQRWRRKEYYVAQCVVIESPVEINASDDGNLVKLISLPFNVKDMLKEGINNGTIPDPTAHNFVIKKTKNAGGQAEYKKSFYNFNDDSFPEEIIEHIESGKSYLYDLSTVTPDPTTTVEVTEWFEKAMAMDNTTAHTTDSGATPDTAATPDNSSAATTPTSSAKTGSSDLASRLKNRTRQ